MSSSLIDSELRYLYCFFFIWIILAGKLMAVLLKLISLYVCKMYYCNMKEELSYFELISLNGGVKMWPKDYMETLWLTERGTVLFNDPKIVVLQMCMKQSYQYSWHCKIIDILFEYGGSNGDIVKIIRITTSSKQNVLYSLVFVIVKVVVSFSKLSHLTNVNLV